MAAPEGYAFIFALRRLFLLMTIKDLLDDLKVEYAEAGSHKHARPGWIQIRYCPFCGSDNFHLGWNLSLSYANCWKCGGHSGLKTLEKLGAARESTKNLLGALDTRDYDGRERKRISLVEPKGRGPLWSSHRRYLRERGFDPEEIVKTWEVEGIGIAGRLAWRLYIPINHLGARVSWTTRAIGTQPQRYLSASAEEEAMNHKELVYGMDYCHHSIVVVEGPLDAWAVGPGAGALFGTAFTSAQVKLLSQIPYRFICFDSSHEAQSRGSELANQLSVFPGETQIIQLDAEDPGSASKKELKLLRKVAKL